MLSGQFNELNAKLVEIVNNVTNLNDSKKSATPKKPPRGAYIINSYPLLTMKTKKGLERYLTRTYNIYIYIYIYIILS